jgi:hypothetical protein
MWSPSDSDDLVVDLAISQSPDEHANQTHLQLTDITGHDE